MYLQLCLEIWEGFKILRLFQQPYFIQMRRFFVAGLFAVSTDYTVYRLFFLFLSPSFSKAIGFISGTFVTYFLNKFWTFDQKKRSLLEVLRFVFLYIVSLFLNIGVNRGILDMTDSLLLAFLCATTVSVVVNFLGLKTWVFR